MRKSPVLAASMLAVVAVALAQDADDRLVRTITDRLRASAAVGQLRIDVRVKDGKVVLEGAARTLSQAWEAREIATKVSGVVEVDADRIAVDARSASGEAIASRLRRRFEDKPELEQGIRMTVEGGTAILSGLVTDARVRFLARETAAEVEGVTGVVDRIESPAQPDDKILTTARYLLGPASLVRVAGHVTPSVQEGVVRLEGWAYRLYDRDLAARQMLGINGVKEVVNAVEVRPYHPGLEIPLD